MMFNDFVQKYNLESEATNKIKTYEVLKKIGLDIKMGTYLWDGLFSTDIGIVNVHPSKGKHWVCSKKGKLLWELRLCLSKETI